MSLKGFKGLFVTSKMMKSPINEQRQVFEKVGKMQVVDFRSAVTSLSLNDMFDYYFIYYYILDNELKNHTICISSNQLTVPLKAAISTFQNKNFKNL